MRQGSLKGMVCAKAERTRDGTKKYFFLKKEDIITRGGLLRLPAAPALRDQGRLRPDALHALLVALPVDGGDGGRALELEVPPPEVLVPDLEAEAEDGRLKAVVLLDHLGRVQKYYIIRQ